MQQARAALGARLREIRVAAGLTASELAYRAGWQRTKISKIEHARQAPTADDLSTWCTHCDAMDQVADLVASLRAVEGMWIEWRRLQLTGMRHQQETLVPLFERTRRFRIYEASVVPALLQTEGYAAARIRRIIDFSGVPDDLDQAVAARIKRQCVLRSASRTFDVVLEEAALYARVGDTDMMAEQLARLISAITMPRVNLGIVPSNIDRVMWASPGFWIYDDDRVVIETPSALLTITQPREVTVYMRTFEALASMALRGVGARRLITEAIAALDR